MATDTQGNVFSPQLPAGFAEAKVLYKGHHEFRTTLESIADHVAKRGQPMTFALYGGWGTGKTTALQYLQGLIQSRNPDAHPAITFSRYEAPLWARHPDERWTLALQIIRRATEGASGKPAEVAQMLSRILERDASGQSRTSAEPANYDLAASLRLLDLLAAVPHAPPVIEEWLRRYLTESGPVRHVVVIDDLDRCPLDFAARLLKATNYWTIADDSFGAGSDPTARHTSQIYFVLACREDFLVESQRESEPDDPRQSLEKYVHVSVTIPQLLSTTEEIAAYLAELTQQLEGLDNDGRTRFAELIHAAGDSYPDGVRAPLLRVEGSATTPRTVKARLNQALTEVNVRLLGAGERGGRLRGEEDLVKEWIVKAFWPSFWHNQYRAKFARPITGEGRDREPGGAGGAEFAPERDSRPRLAAVTARIKPLHALGQRLHGLAGLSDAALLEAMQHLGSEMQADLTDVTPQLAIYLASEPAWPSDPQAEAPSQQERTTRSKETDQARISELPPDASLPGSETTHDLSALESGQVPSDPDDRIQFFYLRADSAEDADRPEDVRIALNELLRIARAQGASSHKGATIGNAGLIAERMGFIDEAYELHTLALQSAPDHYNVMQNFIDFVLSHEKEREYAEARRLYQVLSSQGSEHRPFTTLVLGLRLDSTLEQSVPDSEERVRRAVSLLRQDLSLLKLREIFRVDPSVLGFDTIREIVRIGADGTAARGDEGDVEPVRFFALRNYALLGLSSDPAHERELVDFLRWSLTAGYACAEGEDLLAALLYSLGIQLQSLGYQQAATAVFLEGYRARPTMAALRRALATVLEELGLNEEATAALLGRQIESVDLDLEDLPVFLSEMDGTDRWWEALPSAKERPCAPPHLDWLYVPLEE